MYNIIFTLDKTVYDSFSTEEGSSSVDYFKSLGAEWAGIIPEFREYNGQVGIQANAPTIEVLEAIRLSLQALDHPQVIGVWEKETGEKVEDYDFDSELYLNMLADEVSYDEEGGEVTRKRPTELKQVNKWSGQVDRDIT